MIQLKSRYYHFHRKYNYVYKLMICMRMNDMHCIIFPNCFFYHTFMLICEKIRIKERLLLRPHMQNVADAELLV